MNDSRADYVDAEGLAGAAVLHAGVLGLPGLARASRGGRALVVRPRPARGLSKHQDKHC